MPSVIAELVVAPKGEASNSYGTLEEADAYFATRLHSSVWHNANQTNQRIALIHAARVLDNLVIWAGNKSEYQQALQWPRTGVEDQRNSGHRYGYFDWNEVPVFMKQAQFEQALALLTADPTGDSDTKGIKRIKAGPIDIEFDPKDRPEVLSRQVRDIIKPYGSFPGDGGSMVKRVIRA